ncbi:hypothetical protein R1sor_015979 [Riccia sorocarpa]|uniref:Uncharacterized protein n=1 Tax=Riccia sorocarpa TaxID=122646 RepID=A0ABD3HDR0_9MARC
MIMEQAKDDVPGRVDAPRCWPVVATAYLNVPSTPVEMALDYFLYDGEFAGIDAAKDVVKCLNGGKCVSGSAKKKHKKGRKTLEKTTCAEPVKQEVDAQRQHWLKKVSNLEQALSAAAKCP